MKILIADDSPTSRVILRSYLERMGHTVLEAGDGHEAWAILQRGGVPILISDWLMPGLSGLELCHAIRGRDPRPYIYIILLTSLSGKGAFLEGMNAGADDFISKPFDEEQLAARLRVAERILALQSEVSELREIVPICMYCKRIRNDTNFWQQVETYFSHHAGTQFSHGICPDCYHNVMAPQIKELAALRAEPSGGQPGGSAPVPR